MVRFYVHKIESRSMNPNTGQIWSVMDVPERWRIMVESELQKER